MWCHRPATPVSTASLNDFSRQISDCIGSLLISLTDFHIRWSHRFFFLMMTCLTITASHPSPRLFIPDHAPIFRIPQYQRKILPVCQISEPTDHLFARDISSFSIIYCDVIRDTPFFSVETPISTQFKSDLW